MITNAPLAPVLHDIHVSVVSAVSAEEASLGVAAFWSDDRLIAFTHIEDGGLTLRVGSSPDPVPSAHTPWRKPSRRPTASRLSTETKAKGTR